MSQSAKSPTELAPAATVVLLREGTSGFEVLLMQRAAELAFHGGAWVFPGGRVDAADHIDADMVRVAKQAGARETHEEAGVAIDPDTLVPLSHWTTPEGRSRRFATWFFIAELSPESVVRIDGSEMRDHRWLTPTDALIAHAANELELPPPTFVTLSELVRHRDVRSVLEDARQQAPTFFLPKPRQVQGGWLSLYGGDVAYDEGDHERPGPRHRLCMLDTGWRYERSLPTR